MELAQATSPDSRRSSSGRSHIAYRADIDGLRSIAVLPVILFHIGFTGAAGGFVGVDVFFVISGYLITGIIYREAQAGTFSIARFYERRVRRIFPNLIAMLIATSVIASIVLIPRDLVLFARSVAATLFFAANILFWSSTGYFAPTAQQLPLLHTWSLGVEEQYYLVFPIILMGMSRWGENKLRFSVLGLAIASFAISIVQVAHDPSAAFYLPFARWWELMIGSLLAVGFVPRIRVRIAREAVAAIGLISILFAVIMFDDSTPFPGMAALLPCCGAAALILAGLSGRTLCNDLLSFRLFVLVGRLSYSFYIWRWPIIVFFVYVLQSRLYGLDRMICLVTIVAVSVLAWRYIEEPLRSRTITTGKLLRRVGGGIAILFGFFAVITATAGLPQRYPADVRRIAAGQSDTNPLRAKCDRPTSDRIRSGHACVIGAPNAAPSFAVIGDSFGDALIPGIAREAQEQGVAGIVLTQSGCAPLLGVDERGGLCHDRVAAGYELVRRTPSIDVVLLIGRWPAMIDGKRFGLFPGAAIHIVDVGPGVHSNPSNGSAMFGGFVRSIDALRPARVWIVHGIAEQRVIVPQFAALRALVHEPAKGLDLDAHLRRERSTKRLLASLGRERWFEDIDLGGVMCDASGCPVVAGGNSLYVDDNHPSAYAVTRFRSAFAQALASAKQGGTK